jgi:glycosyltransferase involved in cell wall biosynthesis
MATKLHGDTMNSGGNQASASNPDAGHVLRDTDLGALSVVIPAYNEGAGIARTVSDLVAACPDAEVIVVDDGSTDATPSILRTLEGVTVLTHDRNRGYGAALKTGIRATSRRCIAWYDGDGQHSPADLMAVARPALEGEFDVVIGVRGSDSAKQMDRLVGKALLRWVAQFLTGARIPDLNSGLRCFRRDLLRRYLHLFPDGFSASTTSTILVMERGYRLGYVPIRAMRRTGTSTVKIVSDGLAALNLIVRLVVLFKAFKVFSLLGLSLIVPALLYGVTLALTRGEGFPTLAGTAVIAGMLTFFLGIVADQVAELRKERFEDPWTD